MIALVPVLAFAPTPPACALADLEQALARARSRRAADIVTFKYAIPTDTVRDYPDGKAMVLALVPSLAKLPVKKSKNVRSRGKSRVVSKGG